jgi:sirohydrochlorin cobaltochelatase
MNRSDSSVVPSLLNGAAWPPATGLLVVGHGTADPVGAAETRRVAELAQEALPGMPVELGFLEVIGPSIDDGLARLAAAGCRQVVAAPLLLFAAGHAKRDVPEAIASSAAARGLRVTQAEPLGGHPAVVELSCRRRREAEADRPPLAAAETAVVFIGRGSSDPAALAQLQGFATLSLAAAPPPGHVGFGFVAAARPTLAEALASAADPSGPGVRRIMVQPHLLFRGHVEEQVTAAVDEARRRHAGLEWVQVARLGADPLVAQALVDRAGQACARWETAAVPG